MRPPFGLTEKDLASDVTYSSRVYSRRGNRQLGEIPIEGGTLEVNGEQTVPERLSIDAPPGWIPKNEWSPLAADGQLLSVNIEMVVRSRKYATQLGEFLIQDGTEGTKGKAEVDARGLLQLVDNDPWPYATSPRVGSTLLEESQRLADPLPVILDYGVKDVVLPKNLAWGGDKIEALSDLASRYGFYWMVKADGYLHGVPFPSEIVPVMTYTDTGLALKAPRVWDHSAANTFTVWGKEGTDSKDKVAPIRAHTEINTLGRFDPRYYGTVRDVEELSGSVTSQMVASAAINKALQAGSVIRTWDVEIIPDPRLEYGDVISVILKNGVTITGRVITYSLPLTYEGTMSVKVEEVIW